MRRARPWSSGEHYHSNAFVQQNSLAKLKEHFFAFARVAHAIRQAGAEINVAKKKYAVLHSSYYGTGTIAWSRLAVRQTNARQT